MVSHEKSGEGRPVTTGSGMFRHFVGAGWKRGNQPGGGVTGVKHHWRQLSTHCRCLGGGRRGGKRWRRMGNDPALAIVRWLCNRNLDSLIAVRERVNVLWERVNFPTIDGMSTIACRTPDNSQR